MKFAIGEICLVNALNQYASSKGWTECEIVGYRPSIKYPYIISVPNDPCPQGDSNWFASESHLRKLPPKDEPTTWEVMKDIWTPSHDEVSA